MGKTRFTEEQLDAINARGGTILVSAAAGSGKTAVLVERVLKMVTDSERPVDANRLLVVTFTKLAAAEMRQRLSKRLSEKLSEQPDNAALRRQKLLLQKAHIETIDAFCAGCLREFFAAAGVAPDFRMADDSELKIMQSEILADLIEEKCAEGSTEFLRLVELQGDDRSGDALQKVIKQLDEFVSAYPDPEERLDELASMYGAGVKPENTGWGRTILKRCADHIEYLIAVSDRASDRMCLYPEVQAAYTDIFDSERELLHQLLDVARSGDWDGLLSQLGSVSFARAPSLGKDLEGKQETMDDRAAIKKALTETLPALMCSDGAGFIEDTELCRPAVALLCGLTKEYRARLAAKKDERRLLDFSDLEHKTAKLLYYEKDGRKYRTQTAKELSRRFDEILIDEYQDTNYTQDIIFRALSNEGTDEIGGGSNMFMVGDVKQSIYGFRKAVPRLFLERLNNPEYKRYDRNNPQFPATIILDKNFRSRPEVTETVNFIFRRLMTEKRGGLVYNERQKLSAAGTFPEAENRATELHLLESAAATDDETRDIVEARYCARLIKKLISDGFEVTYRTSDGQSAMRPAGYGDICIMRRGISGGHGDAFVEQLGAMGIPVSMNTDKGFFRAPEICVMISLLRAIDNPLLNIPLAACLRSPIFGFSSERLALLQAIGGRRSSVYSNLMAGAKEDDALCKNALELLSSLRADAACMPSDRLISEIYRRTGYLAAVQAMRDGETRRRNLLLLRDYAGSYERNGARGLSGFISMIDRMQEQGEDLASAATTGREGCVVVRTMHNAKGLEFPVCILAGLGSGQNVQAYKGNVLIHDRLGVGMNIYDPEKRLRYPTVQRRAAYHANVSDDTDEELRVLYVAMTRAVDKLIMLSTTEKNSSADKKALMASSIVFEDGISPFALGLSPSPGQWVTACALLHPDGGALRERVGFIYEPEQSGVALKVSIVESEDETLSPIEAEPTRSETDFAPDEEAVAQLAASMDYRYRYSGLDGIPAKVTASQTRSHAQSIGTTRPSFMGEQGLSPTERGTALHRFMQFCDFEKAAADPQGEIERLVRGGFITKREGAAVELNKVNDIFGGPLWALISSADRVEREWRFTARLPANMLDMFTGAPVDPGDELILLEGECDLLLIKGDGVVIIDYKTDRVKSTDALLERYSEQLRLYAEAVAQVMEKKVKQCFVYSFALSELRAVERV